VFYCKSGDCLKDNGGVHTNSGVNNKAVYLMVDGGQFGGRNVKALGWLKTLSIYYEAQTTLLTSGSDYLDLYNVLYQACLNKVGTNNISLVDCTEVRDATLAVKMNAKVTASFAPDVALCPSGTTAVMPGLFYDDFETGVNGWTLGTLFGESAWELSNNNAKSGTSSLWANDIHETSDSYAATKRILLPTGSKPYLHFSHTFNFETDAGVNYDGGVLEYSINNGTTWIDAKPLFSAGRNYTGAIKPDTDNKLAGRAGFVNASHGYVDSRYNLTTLVGKSIQFRWRMGTDTAGNLRGWHVDNVRIYLCVSKPGIPTLMKPLNQSSTNDITPTFAWTDSTPDLHHYELQIAADINFVNIIRRYNNIAMSTFTPTTALMLDDTYYWRVRAFNAAGKSSAWSEVWEFTIP
jgi:hypothetical protein